MLIDKLVYMSLFVKDADDFNYASIAIMNKNMSHL